MKKTNEGAVYMRRGPVSGRHMAGLGKYRVPIDRLVNPYLLEFESGEFLCRDRDPVERIFFLLEGRAKIFVTADSGENLILSLWDGYGVLCDMELFMGDGVYHISCQAISPVRGVALPLDVNREILLSSNEYLRHTCASFAWSMEKDRNVFNNILYPAEARLCSYIATTETAGVWNDNLSRVSELLGISYRHLLRTLRGLCEKGVLRKTGRGYMVADRGALQAYNKGFITRDEA